MMDNTNQQQEALLDSALNKMAIAPLPPEFTNQVMTVIHAAVAQSGQRQALHNNSSTTIRYRLHFLDIALAMFWSLTLAVVWIFVLWWTGVLRLDWLPQLQSSYSFIDHLAVTNPAYLLGGIILLLLEISVLGLVGMNLLGERPTAPCNHSQI